MIRFECDYLEGCHPQILDRLARINLEQRPGYGEDDLCASARAKIRALIGRDNAQVHFLVGGTQVNATVICAMLRPHQGVISAATGHIGVHESGAVEATGHKVLTLPSTDGKITAEAVRALWQTHFDDSTHEHMVQPAMVYISYPTENGTLYAKGELQALYQTCRACGMKLYIDGARLGYGLGSPLSGMTIRDIADNCDAFTIGGTKVGLLFGEALVFTDPALSTDFRYILKQRGGMLAKGFLLGAQYDEILTDNLYFAIGQKATAQALRIRKAFEEKGVALRYDSPTNQQYPILTQAQRQALARKYSFAFWERMDDDLAAVRFCTSWATPDEHVDELIEDIGRL